MMVNSIFQFNLFNFINFKISSVDDYNYQAYNYGDQPERYDPAAKSKEQEFNPRILINRTRPEKCDKIITLFQLMQSNENKMHKPYEKEMSSDCTRPFIVYPIQATNMILVAVNTLCENSYQFINNPIEKDNNMTLPCFKAKASPLYRRGLKECFNQHTNESQIELCGRADKFFMSFSMIIITLVSVFRNILISLSN